MSILLSIKDNARQCAWIIYLSGNHALRGIPRLTSVRLLQCACTGTKKSQFAQA